MLKLVLPKGSLEKATLELFADADLAVHRSSSVTYSATIDDPRIGSVRILRPQEIPTYVAEGLFDQLEVHAVQLVGAVEPDVCDLTVDLGQHPWFGHPEMLSPAFRGMAFG